MDSQIHTGTSLREDAAQFAIASTLERFWIIFECPELHDLIFKEIPQNELKALMLVNKRFAETLRPLVWKALELKGYQTIVPSENSSIQNACLIRNLSTDSPTLVQHLATSGTCTRLRSLKVEYNRHRYYKNERSTGNDIWTLVRLNPQLECLHYSANYSICTLFSSELRSSLMSLQPGQRVSPFQRMSLVEISLKNVRFGQNHLQELFNLCPNLEILSIEDCASEARKDPFGGNRSCIPRKLTNLTFTPFKSFAKPWDSRGRVNLCFKDASRSTLNHLGLYHCGKRVLNALQQSLNNRLVDWQALLKLYSPKSDSSTDEDLRDFVDATALCSRLKHIYLRRIRLGPLSIDALFCGLHAQTLTALELSFCLGVKSRNIQKIMVHCTKLREIVVDSSTSHFNVSDCNGSDWGCKDLRIIRWHLRSANQQSPFKPMSRQLGQLLELREISFTFYTPYHVRMTHLVELLSTCIKIQRLVIKTVHKEEEHKVSEWCKEMWPLAEVSIYAHEPWRW